MIQSFNTYQQQAMSTAVYPRIGHNISYPTLGLCGEAGEIANKVKKIDRDDKGVITQARREELIDELGDVLWYIAAAAHELNISLSEVASRNIKKLNARKQKNTLTGDGDSH